MPIGPVLVLVLQKSLTRGRKDAFATGLGGTIVDTACATLAIFALSYAQKFLETHEVAIYFIGGGVLAMIGIGIAFTDPFKKLKPEQESTTPLKGMLQAAAMGFSNPTAIIVMFGLMTLFKIRVENHGPEIFLVLMAICLGSATWWFVLTYFLKKLRGRLDTKKILWGSRIAGIVILIFGIVLLVKGIVRII